MVLLDTNVWSLTLLQSGRLSARARQVIDAAETRYVSAASLYEINQKVRLGKWPAMAPFAPNLIAFASAQGVQAIDLDADICARAGALAWVHRDPFDRLLAATALVYEVPIISSDRVFDDVVTRIW